MIRIITIIITTVTTPWLNQKSRAIVWLEGLGELKKSTSLGPEPVTFWLAA
jgi:hypothetical protein